MKIESLSPEVKNICRVYLHAAKGDIAYACKRIRDDISVAKDSGIALPVCFPDYANALVLLDAARKSKATYMGETA